MKKKLFLGAGAAILVAAAAFAGRASAKFSAAGLYYTVGTVCQKISGTPTGAIVTNSGTKQAKITTSTNGTVQVLLFATSTCTDKAFFVF
jgi:hypothetical protein